MGTPSAPLSSAVSHLPHYADVEFAHSDDDDPSNSSGHGLSYGAEFSYSEFKITPDTVSLKHDADVIVKVSFKVTNNGTGMAAEEVVQLYTRDKLSSVTTPVMELKGFKRLAPIAAGASVDVILELKPREHLTLINLALEKVVEPGDFVIMVGGASDAIQLNGVLKVVA